MIAGHPSATYKSRTIDESFAVAIKYGIGVEYTPDEFGMTHGPYNTIRECLEEFPVLSKKVFALELPSCEKLYRWNGEEWFKL